MKEKDRFRKAPPNYAMKKTQLLKDKVKKNSCFTTTWKKYKETMFNPVFLMLSAKSANWNIQITSEKNILTWMKLSIHTERNCTVHWAVVSLWLSVSQSVFFLLGLKAMAEESGDGDKVKVIQDELNELEERAEALDRQRTKNISAIRYINYT